MINLAEALRRARGDTSEATAPLEDPFALFAGDRVLAPRRWDFEAAKIGEPAPVAPPQVSEEAPETVDDAVTSDDVGLADDSETPSGGRRRRWLVAAALITAIVGGALVWQRTIAESRLAASQAVATRGVIRQIVGGKGKVEPAAEVRLTANLFGRIQTINVQDGDRVQAGDVVAEMESADLRAQLDQARSRLEEARAKLAEVESGPRPQELEAARTRVAEAEAVRREANAVLTRARVLHERGLIARIELDEADTRHATADAQLRAAEQELSLLSEGARPEVRQLLAAQYRTAEAAVREAETQMSYAAIRTPIAGVVLHRLMEPGEVIVMQRPQPILTVADISRLIVRAEIDESDMSKVKIGQEAIVTSVSHTTPFTGRVIDLAPAIGRKTISSDDPAEMLDAKVLEATIELAPNTPLKLGQTVDVEITAALRDRVTVVPREALEHRNGEWFATVKTPGGWVRRSVTRGEEDGTNVEILSGVAEGDIVAARSNGR